MRWGHFHLWHFVPARGAWTITFPPDLAFSFPHITVLAFLTKTPPVSTQAHGVYCSSSPGDRYSRTFLLSLASCWNLSRQSISVHTNKLHGRQSRWASRAIANLQVDVLILSFIHTTYRCTLSKLDNPFFFLDLHFWMCHWAKKLHFYWIQAG